ncbi:hypothetical protein [Clostridium butyricum]|uniref:hypothetical protein n=1 Tax=Clostridium butyricum TaxID=1492 RepID=UPI0034671191
MSKIVMEWCRANIDGKSKLIYVQNMEKDIYENEYKGKLTCIHGCDARIKFTERKNGIKFYSTWNKEGDKHEEDCEFHVNYKGKVGRKRLLAEERRREITEEQIEKAIERKISNLKIIDVGNNSGKAKQSTYKVENTGLATAKVSSEGANVTEAGLKRENVTSIESSLINSTYVDRRKCVYGMINNVQYEYSDSGELYGYLNLQNEHHNVSVYFPPAFYNDEYNDEDKLKKFLNILKKEIKEKNKKVMVVCFGTIKSKKKNKDEFNIHVINPLHIRINEMSVDKVIEKASINEIDYYIV